MKPAALHANYSKKNLNGRVEKIFARNQQYLCLEADFWGKYLKLYVKNLYFSVIKCLIILLGL